MPGYLYLVYEMNTFSFWKWTVIIYLNRENLFFSVIILDTS